LMATRPRITLPAPMPITPILGEMGVTRKPRRVKSAAINNGMEKRGMDIFMPPSSGYRILIVSFIIALQISNSDLHSGFFLRDGTRIYLIDGYDKR
jgi:hypothetical protein